MFVLSTRYEKALSEKQHLANSVTELSAQIKNLQASNDQAYADAQAKALANMSPEKYERILVTCMLESLKQVEGIRQTVLDSFQKMKNRAMLYKILISCLAYLLIHSIRFLHR